jgi:ribonucleoside-diphosphate reductase alpha chain
MVVPRVFSAEGVSPYDQVDWDLRTASIKDEAGRVIFEQADCEIPRAWSQLATNVVVSKYFYGEAGTAERETSVRQLIDRVTRTIADWGRPTATSPRPRTGTLLRRVDGALPEPVRLVQLSGLVQRRAVSQVWHRGAGQQLAVGRETRGVVRVDAAYKYPQGSACFIQSVSDDMEGIMRLAHSEAMLFKYGSGTGTDLSTIRSSHERFSGGGGRRPAQLHARLRLDRQASSRAAARPAAPPRCRR